eukprot:9799559-Ditylum_brightwellii.AAC.1
MQCRFSSWSGMLALTQSANHVPDNQGLQLRASGAVAVVQLHKDDDDDKHFIQGIRHCLEMLKKHNIQSWLENSLSWNAPQDKPAQTLFIPPGAMCVPDSQAVLVATHSISPDSRVA